MCVCRGLGWGVSQGLFALQEGEAGHVLLQGLHPEAVAALAVDCVLPDRRWQLLVSPVLW